MEFIYTVTLWVNFSKNIIGSTLTTMRMSSSVAIILKEVIGVMLTLFFSNSIVHGGELVSFSLYIL